MTTNGPKAPGGNNRINSETGLFSSRSKKYFSRGPVMPPLMSVLHACLVHHPFIVFRTPQVQNGFTTGHPVLEGNETLLQNLQNTGGGVLV